MSLYVDIAKQQNWLHPEGQVNTKESGHQLNHNVYTNNTSYVHIFIKMLIGDI